MISLKQRSKQVEHVEMCTNSKPFVSLSGLSLLKSAFYQTYHSLWCFIGWWHSQPAVYFCVCFLACVVISLQHHLWIIQMRLMVVPIVNAFHGEDRKDELPNVFHLEVDLTSIIITKSNNTIFARIVCSKTSQKIAADFGSEMTEPHHQWMCPLYTGFEAALISSLLPSPSLKLLSTSVKRWHFLSSMAQKQTTTNLLPISSMT